MMPAGSQPGPCRHRQSFHQGPLSLLHPAKGHLPSSPALARGMAYPRAGPPRSQVLQQGSLQGQPSIREEGRWREERRPRRAALWWEVSRVSGPRSPMGLQKFLVSVRLLHLLALCPCACASICWEALLFSSLQVLIPPDFHSESQEVCALWRHPCGCFVSCLCRIWPGVPGGLAGVPWRGWRGVLNCPGQLGWGSLEDKHSAPVSSVCPSPSSVPGKRAGTGNRRPGEQPFQE